VTLATRFARIAGAVTAKVGGPYVSAQILRDAVPGHYDDNGAWIPGTPATPIACMCQVDDATEFMRTNEGYADGEVRFVILRDAGLALDTDARIEVLAGPKAGVWLVSSLSLDPIGIGWTGKGKRGA
jgi:hypothetical protein